MAEEKQIITTIKKVMPAVVSVVIAKHLEDLEKEIPPELYPFLPQGPHGPHLEIPQELIDKRGMVKIGGGSGFIVEADGLVLTNKHVVGDPKAEYTVITDDGRKLPGKIISRDPINDVPILKIEASSLPTVKRKSAPCAISGPSSSMLLLARMAPPTPASSTSYSRPTSS